MIPSRANCVVSPLLLIALAFGCVGCGDGDRGYVTGQVTLEGQPVGPGTLIFEPADEGRRNGPSSMGYFDESGKFEVVSSGGKKGAITGNYKVIIMAGGPSSLAEEAEAAEQKPTKIPSKYFDYDGGLTANIKKGEQEINFDLQP